MGGPKLLKNDDDDQAKIPGTEDDDDTVEGMPPVPDAAQLKLQGIKPAAIEEVENAFDAYIEAKNKKDSAVTRMNDAKEVLLTRMKENKIPMYGKKCGKEKYIAAIDVQEVVLVKKSKPERK
jgi:hypothetical protein